MARGKKMAEGPNQRHKCSMCGKVRFKKFLEPMMNGAVKKSQLKTRYGNACWVCVDNPDCQHKKEHWRPY